MAQFSRRTPRDQHPNRLAVARERLGAPDYDLTGSFVHPDDATYLAGMCRDRGWALVADEVFFPYPFDPENAAARTFAGPSPCLTCTLGGLSKSAGLPQIKLAWIVLSGPDDEVAEAAARLDYISDAYLSVSTPSALAAPELMVRGGAIHEAILARCRANLDTLLSLVSRVPAVTLTAPQGGWSAILRVPVVIDGEELALRLLEEHGVAVHPGFLFDLPSEGHLVLSLLPREEVFAEGVRRLLSVVSGLVEN